MYWPKWTAIKTGLFYLSQSPLSRYSLFTTDWKMAIYPRIAIVPSVVLSRKRNILYRKWVNKPIWYECEDKYLINSIVKYNHLINTQFFRKKYRQCLIIPRHSDSLPRLEYNQFPRKHVEYFSHHFRILFSFRCYSKWKPVPSSVYPCRNTKLKTVEFTKMCLVNIWQHIMDHMLICCRVRVLVFFLQNQPLWIVAQIPLSSIQWMHNNNYLTCTL